MSNEWDSLLDDDVETIPTVLESKKVENKPKKVEKKKLESKAPDSESKPKIIPESKKEIDPDKILDINRLWEVLCDLRGEFGVNELLALLTTKSVQGVSHCNSKIVNFKRTPAATSIIALFRELKKRGYF